MAGTITVGVDVGTGGVRAVAADRSGVVVAEAEQPLPASASPQPGRVEQRPVDWWDGVRGCLRRIGGELGSGALKAAAVCVDSTSGTILPIDESGAPLRDALMYNDARAGREADDLNEAGAELTGRMGYRFNSSYGLAKILWLARHEPDTCSNARFVNAADFLTGKLCGEWGRTDYTNALKMGYDLLEDCWPAWLADVGVDPGKLPRVHRSGSVVGRVSKAAAAETGLAPDTPVAIGPTDGVAAFYACGARQPGESGSTLGTTLVLKSLSRSILLDPRGRIYCHKHAEGFWLPGGASNCGCEYAGRFFPDADLDALGAEAERFLPCKVLLYPLARKGERFPVVAPKAERFLSEGPSCEAEGFAAYLQAIAFVERWAYEIVAGLGGEAAGAVYTSGGGSRSDMWMQLRADALGRETARTAMPDSAFGSAVLAASQTMFDGIGQAGESMIRESARFSPRPDRGAQYDDLYRSFRRECSRRGLE